MKEGHFNIISHPEIILCYLSVLPVIYWFFKNSLDSKVFVYGILFIISFSGGTLELFGFSTTYTRLIMEALVGFIFIRTFIIPENKRFHFPSIIIVVGFIIIALFSYLLNSLKFIQLILFYRDFLPIFFFFYALTNTLFTKKEERLLTKLVFCLFVSQIFSAMIKVAVLGNIAEEFIGTIINQGGSVTIIFALFGASYCIVSYLLKSEKKYLLGIVGFFIFSLTGGKRATIFYFPLIYFIAIYLINLKVKKSTINIGKKIATSLLLVFLIVYTSARIMPSLNPENQVGGSFDYEFIINYSQEYTAGEKQGRGFIGRPESPAYLTNLLIFQNSEKMLFGFGAGQLVKSEYNEYTNGKTSDEITESKYGVGYGARTGFLQMLLQVGFLGVVFYTLFFISLFVTLLRKNIIKFKKRDTILYLTSLLIIIIILLDYYTYSFVSSMIGAISLSFMWVLGVTFRKTLPSKGSE